MSARACWIDFGNDPSYAQLQTHGITEAVFDIRDPRLTKTYLAQVQAKGLKPGVYAAWNWPETKALDGPGFADWVDAKLKALNISQNVPLVHLNDETHDPVRIVHMLFRWRALRPKKRTLWSCEGAQGGWMTPDFVSDVRKCNVTVGVQLYNGAMTEVWDSLEIARDLTSRGFLNHEIAPFHDASRLPGYWSGTAFTQGRLV